MSNIANKLIIIAENQQKVYDKGYAEGQRALVNEDMIIEKTVSGEMIYINDISEIPHNVIVQLSSDTITDFSDVKIEVLGKNLINIDNIILGEKIQGSGVGGNIFTIADSTCAVIESFKVWPNTSYTFSLDNTNYWLNRMVELDENLICTVNHSFYASSKDYSEYTFVPNYQTKYIALSFINKNNENATFEDLKNINIQFERSSSKTSYEPYKINEYTSNETGIINVASFYPFMNFNTDNPEISLSVTYWQSYGIFLERNRFWDSYQAKGNRTDYDSAFRMNWNDDVFYPKYDITPTNLNNAFFDAKISNLKGILEEQGVQLNTSQCPYFTYAFRSSYITQLPEIDASSTTSLTLTFYYMENLTSIDKLIVTEKLTSYNSTFYGCSNLENLIIEGTIAGNISLYASKKLSKDSIISIINALSLTTSELTVTFSSVAVKTAFDTTDPATCEEWLALKGTKSNWTFSLV